MPVNCFLFRFNIFASMIYIKKCITFLLATLFCIFLHPQAHAQDLPDITEYATDFTHTLSQDDIVSLRKDLSDFHRKKGSQIVVVIITSTGDTAIEDYANALFRKLKIGRAGINDGLLLLVAKDDRHMRIEVGYGLEGAIPDIKAQRIINEQIKPEFKNDDYYAGIKNGVVSLEKLINGEDLPAPKIHVHTTKGGWVVLLLLFTSFILGFLGGLRKVSWKSGALVLGTATAISCLVMLSPLPLFFVPFSAFPIIMGYVFSVSKTIRIIVFCLVAYALTGFILNNHFGIKIGPLYIIVPFMACFFGFFIWGMTRAVLGKHTSGGQGGDSSGWSSSSASDWSSSSSDSFSGDGGSSGGGGASGSW